MATKKDSVNPSLVMQRLLTLVDRFEAQVRSNPDTVAIRYNDQQLTYAELDRRANAVAEAVVENSAGPPEQLVGLCIDRSINLLVGLIGILKAGKGYVPIDITLPRARVEFLVADAGLTQVVTDAGQVDRFRDFSVRTTMVTDDELDRPLNLEVQPSDLAYVIYTSGTTGTPKGVMVEHRHVCRLFDSTSTYFPMEVASRWTLFHSVSFDFSVWEIWGALLHGSTLIIVPSVTARTPNAFAELVARERVTMLSQTPSAFNVFVEAVLARPDLDLSALAYVVFGGEKLNLRALRPWVDRFGLNSPSLVNMYGITETTVHVTHKRITEADLMADKDSPIGAPLADLEVHLLSENNDILEGDGVGEMLISGSGVTRGYLGRPELTDERFVVMPLGRGQTPTRCYRSGDLAERVDGNLRYLRRSDDQLKVRGFRIEPGEVESQLLDLDEVAAAVVVPHLDSGGDHYLVAFVMPSGPHDGRKIEADVRAHCRAFLPVQLRPAGVVVVDEIPLTDNGKADRRALASRFARQIEGEGASIDGSSPSTCRTELFRLADELFVQTSIDPELDLFEQGATSLALTRLLADATRRFEVEISPLDIEGDVTLRKIAQLVDAQMAEVVE